MTIMKGNKSVAVIGLGYVGLPLALLADRKGYKVIGIDVDEKKVAMINSRISPFTADKEISEHIRSSSIEATTDFSRTKDVSVVIICVPTPVYDNNMPNLEPLKHACTMIGQNLKKGHLIILESTVNPGVCNTIVLPLLEENSGLRGGEDFYLAHCPERLNPGDKKWTVENIPRVIGGLNDESLKRAMKFYEGLISAQIKPMGSLMEAEAVKIVENTFRDINIAFVNELAMSFSKIGIDVVKVIEGASTKPFGFMPHFPGCGVGGHCIPVDPYYLIEYAKNRGFHHDFLSLARRINEQMPGFTVQVAIEALNSNQMPLKGSNIAVLGLAYKPEIDDCRESPAFKIIELLRSYEANVIAYDPFVPSRSDVASLEEALSKADAIIIATAHEVFRNLTPEDLLKHNVKVVIDGRNCLPKDDFIKAGITYRGIGR